MDIEFLRSKLHEIVDKINDEAVLNMMMEDAAVYIRESNLPATDDITPEQWQKIEQARAQIKNGEYKTYPEVKQHFAQWLTK